jgi:UDPglucose 6-dehydrogenase
MVTVIGLGFVGLTTALGFAEYGHQVYGIEANAARLDTIRSGALPFAEPGLDEALRRHLNRKFIPTENWDEAIADSDFVYYCVGTPYGEDGQADLTYLYSAIEQTVAAIHDDRFRVLVIKSTVPPSTTADRVIPFLKEKGIEIPKQLGVANNPEFLREGHCWEDFTHPDRIVLGVQDARSEQMLRALYSMETASICCVSLNTGEFIKYLSNTSLACLISYANEMSMAADAIGGIDTADAFQVLHMDKRWQTGTIRSYFYPGCGYGGYCLPKDTSAFYMAAKRHGISCSILKNVVEMNDRMPEITAQKIAHAAGGDKDACIGILGLAFNPGSDDVRDTPSAKIIQALNKAGFQKIAAYDPVAVQAFQREYQLKCQYIESYEETIAKADVLAIATAWPVFRDIRKRTGKPVVDCRYMLK